MRGRTIGGLVVAAFGLLISLIFIFSKSEEAVISLYYGLPILVIGLFIIFNKNEDKIEKIKGGYKEK